MKAKVTVNPGDSIIHIEREFDAPRAKVFEAMTRKDLVGKWWLGSGDNITIEELDAREGGSWRFVQVADGKSYGFFGRYHEVAAPERIIQTFEFDGLPERGHVSMEKMELTELEGGRTRMNVTSVFFSEADRDGMIQSGMEGGMQKTYDALDKVLSTMV